MKFKCQLRLVVTIASHWPWLARGMDSNVSPLWVKIAYFNNVWIECHEILYRQRLIPYPLIPSLCVLCYLANASDDEHSKQNTCKTTGGKHFYCEHISMLTLQAWKCRYSKLLRWNYASQQIHVNVCANLHYEGVHSLEKGLVCTCTNSELSVDWSI